MSKIKFALGMSTVLALVALTATPALARWTNHGGKGLIKAGEVVLTYEGAALKCAGAEAIYKVNSEGTAVTLEEIKWNKCKALGLEAIVTCTTIEHKQPVKEGSEKGKSLVTIVTTGCITKTSACEIDVPTEGNKELEETTMKKVGANTEADVSLKGLTATAKGSGCALGGITKEKTAVATVKIPSVVAEGLGLE